MCDPRINWLPVPTTAMVGFGMKQKFLAAGVALETIGKNIIPVATGNKFGESCLAYWVWVFDFRNRLISQILACNLDGLFKLVRLSDSKPNTKVATLYTGHGSVTPLTFKVEHLPRRRLAFMQGERKQNQRSNKL